MLGQLGVIGVGRVKEALLGRLVVGAGRVVLVVPGRLVALATPPQAWVVAEVVLRGAVRQVGHVPARLGVVVLGHFVVVQEDRVVEALLGRVVEVGSVVLLVRLCSVGLPVLTATGTQAVRQRPLDHRARALPPPDGLHVVVLDRVVVGPQGGEVVALVVVRLAPGPEGLCAAGAGPLVEHQNWPLLLLKGTIRHHEGSPRCQLRLLGIFEFAAPLIPSRIMFIMRRCQSCRPRQHCCHKESPRHDSQAGKSSKRLRRSKGRACQISKSMCSFKARTAGLYGRFSMHEWRCATVQQKTAVLLCVV